MSLLYYARVVSCVLVYPNKMMWWEGPPISSPLLWLLGGGRGAEPPDLSTQRGIDEKAGDDIICTVCRWVHLIAANSRPYYTVSSCTI